MKKSSIALRRGVATLALTWPGAQAGTAAAADAPNCAGGGGTGVIEVNVAALTSDGRLLCFKRRQASSAREIGYITGLMAADTRLIGIDYRVRDGMLYGAGNGGGVYRIDTDTAVAEFVNSLSVPLTGAAFGVDSTRAPARACSTSTPSSIRWCCSRRPIRARLPPRAKRRSMRRRT